MKISFLILTHNRPHLFLRCINSILQFKFSYPVEILVNNDSNDISEINIPDYNIKYFYYNNPNIGYIYKLLFDQSTGEYIFFLEDDDYLSDIFDISPKAKLTWLVFIIPSILKYLLWCYDNTALLHKKSEY